MKYLLAFSTKLNVSLSRLCRLSWKYLNLWACIYISFFVIFCQNLLFECMSDFSYEKIDLFKLNGSPAAFVCWPLLDTFICVVILFIIFNEVRKKQILKLNPFWHHMSNKYSPCCMEASAKHTFQINWCWFFEIIVHEYSYTVFDIPYNGPYLFANDTIEPHVFGCGKYFQ